MYAKNRKSRFLLIATLSGALMTGGIALAGEEELMVPGPEMTFGLQTQVQIALNLQIEQQASDTLAEHQIAQEFKQAPVINTHRTEKRGMAEDPAKVIRLNQTNTGLACL